VVDFFRWITLSLGPSYNVVVEAFPFDGPRNTAIIYWELFTSSSRGFFWWRGCDSRSSPPRAPYFKTSIFFDDLFADALLFPESHAF